MFIQIENQRCAIAYFKVTENVMGIQLRDILNGVFECCKYFHCKKVSIDIQSHCDKILILILPHLQNQHSILMRFKFAYSLLISHISLSRDYLSLRLMYFSTMIRLLNHFPCL